MNTTRRVSGSALPQGSATVQEKLLREARTRRRWQALNQRGMGPWLAMLALALAVVCSWSSEASAYTWMIRHSYSACATCHADPSGGELLTQYGRVTADMILRMQYGERKPDAKEPSPGVLWGLWTPPDALLLGGGYRNLSVIRPTEAGSEYTFIPAMQADIYGQLHLGIFRIGGSLGLGRARPGSTNGRLAQVTTNEDGYNLVSRSHYIGLDLDKNKKWVLRGGRLNQPFGLRIPEHNAWVREATRTDRESDQQHGLTLSYVSEKLRGEIMAIAGNYQVGPDAFRERGYSMFVEGIAGTSFASGVSSKVTYAEYDLYDRTVDPTTNSVTPETDTVRQAHGIFGRWAPTKQLFMMAEVDALFRVNADAGYVAFGQVDYEPLTGLHFILTGELQDKGRYVTSTTPAKPGNGNPQFGGWLSVDWFFWKQMEMRVDALLRQDEPFTMLAQLHLYL